MKLRWRIVVGLAAVGITVAVVLLRLCGAQTALQETRRSLSQQGFKTDLAQFDFSATPEMRKRAAALTTLGNWIRKPILMSPAGPDAAIILWKEDPMPEEPYQQSLTPVEEAVEVHGEELDAACAAALAGPIRFDLDASKGSAMPLPHLASLQTLGRSLAAGVIIDIREQDKDGAWTNLMACTRLATGWSPEPVDFSHQTRFECAECACNAAWQALQAGGWTDDRLAALQREWESVDFFHDLPETAAFFRASMAEVCQRDRSQGRPSPPIPTPEMLFRQPGRGWGNLVARWRRICFLGGESSAEENDFLLYYRDREVELQHAIRCSTWKQMRQLPGVTNTVPFKPSYRASAYRSAAQQMIRFRIMAPKVLGDSKSLLERAAEAEARRRLVIAALALDRFRLSHGAYPKSLAELAPDFLKSVPIDFMDGQPLRYRPTADGHFVLYSVGLDCVDHGGLMPQHKEDSPAYPGSPGFVAREQVDIVWPRPASDGEANAERTAEQRFREKRRADARAKEARREQEAETARQARVKELLSAKPSRNAKEPKLDGVPLTEVLSNGKPSSRLTLDEMLTLKRIVTTNDPDIVTLELPISYDVITNEHKFHLALRLLLDAPANDAATYGSFQDCEQADNGDCLLVWNTRYDPPGQHALQARLYYGRDSLEIRGPVEPFFSSNLFQFEPFYGSFGPNGATLYAKLAERNGIYTIELTSPSGAHLKTFHGTTSNGIIDVDWNLIDDQGRRFTNDSFNTSYNITLPDSGRSENQIAP